MLDMAQGLEPTSRPAAARAHEDSPRLDVGSGALLATAALAPLPFGSVDPVSSSVFCAVLAVGLIFKSPAYVDGRRGALLIWISVLIGAYALVLHEQISLTPWFGQVDPIWARASAALGVQLQGTVSLIKLQPLFALGNTFACFSALCLSLVVGSDRREARRLLWVIACSGACYAAYGIFAALVTPTELLWLDRPGYVGDVTGTFVNRNTAATYFGCMGVIWLLLLLESLKRKLPRSTVSFSRFLRRATRRPTRGEVASSVGLILCLMALLMTGSRAGVVFSLIGMIVAGSVVLRSVSPRRGGVYWLGIGGAVTALALVQTFGGMVGEHFQTAGLSDEGRFDTYASIARLIADHPLFGTGLGTFETAFPSYRQMSPGMQGVWSMGHSTPLELAAELGVPLTIFVCLTVVVGFFIMSRGAFSRRRDEVIPLAGATSLGISVAHSCFDFSLQITGFAIVLMIVVGVGLAQSFSTRRLSDAEGTHIKANL